MELSNFFTPWILQIIAMILTVLLIPKLELSSITGVIFIVLAISLVNAFLWDASLFFSMPESLSARAFQLLLVNGCIFWLLVKLLPGIETEGFIPCLVAPLIFTGCSVLAHRYGESINWSEAFRQASVIAIDSSHRLRDYFQNAK